jgi:hypothetical protein
MDCSARLGMTDCVLPLGSPFSTETLRQDALGTTIANSLDLSHPPVSSFSLHLLRKLQLRLQDSLDKKCPIDLLSQPFFYSLSQNLWAMAL